MKIPATATLDEICWVPRNRLTPLARLGLLRLGDLLVHYPRRHEDRRQFGQFPGTETIEPVCLCGDVVRTAAKFFRRGMRCFEAHIEEPDRGGLGGILLCRWFNAPYVQKAICTGQRLVLFGRPKLRKHQLVVEHPEFEIIEDDAELSVHFGRITPVHPAGEGIPAKGLRTLIHRALGEADPESVASLAPGTDGTDRLGLLRALHFPESWEELETARPQLAFEELFALQAVLVSRREDARRKPGSAKNAEGRLLRKLRATLPFQLTGGQQTVIEEIRRDLEAPEPMQRLLQGDVGSGKTIVALGAALHTIEAGWQAALMAPTQILAEQHFRTFRSLLDPLGLQVALVTGDKKSIPHSLPLFGDSEYPQLVVGTHALLYDGAGLPRLGLAIIDEQHKFGVLQRARLLQRGVAPDLLVLTATPIPRTLTQTIYGDLDVSVLREKPAGRQQVVTAVRPESKLPKIAEFVRQQLDAGRQAFIVYPLIDESDKLQAKAATGERERWAQILAPHAVGLLHGRLAPEDKDAVMAAFRDGRTAALVATTVVEVGVDIPNATIMLVENAERFGLAQLHQLRGRVGRGAHKSYCVLVYGPKAEEAAEKLAVLEASDDGFVIAEADLKFRGPGDLVGTAQTGLPPLRIANLLRDGDLMTRARASARQILTADPDLREPRNRALAAYLQSCHRRLLAAAG